ncbi:MAG: sporulation protein YtfJ [Clostridiales bacterium]|nr:sporulation protein YtfJ [Clostridiales bacterium]
MAENKLREIIDASLEQIKNVVDANTIVGTPITTPNGTTILPISKVMVGFASGGLDFRGKNAKEAPVPNNFGGGGGTGVTVQPVGFLVVGADGNVQLLNVGASSPEADKFESISNLIEKSPDVISKIASIFKKDKPTDDKKDDNTESEEENTAE